MFDESGNDFGAAARPLGEEGRTSHVGRGWREIDRCVRRLAARRAAMDVEEAKLLMEARRAEVHKQLGYGSFDEYIERALGYAPHTGRERMRVAEEIETLPAIAEAWERGDLSYSVVREMTRKATPENELVMLEWVNGLTVREVEQGLRGHKKGDDPNGPPDPDVEPRVVRMELPPAVYAAFLDARRHVERATGSSMTDAEFMAVACRAVLGGVAADPSNDEKADNLPPHQIAIVVCDQCNRGWQDTPGRSVELPQAQIQRMRCDAVELGPVDGDAKSLKRARRPIPPRTRKAVLARDHHRCSVPGCTMSRYVDVHHIVPPRAGGSNDPRNLITLCERHHSQHHEGIITIAGEAGALIVTHRDGRPYGTAPPDGGIPF
jgi:hypothetical protein